MGVRTVLALTGTPRIFLYRSPTDLRKSFDGLSGLVRQHFGEQLYSAAFYVFVNRRRCPDSGTHLRM